MPTEPRRKDVILKDPATLVVEREKLDSSFRFEDIESLPSLGSIATIRSAHSYACSPGEALRNILCRLDHYSLEGYRIFEDVFFSPT